MQETIRSARISSLFLFLYAWSTCFNQYIKLFGIPLFMYVQAVLIIYGAYINRFKIRINSGNRATPILTMTIWMLYGLLYAGIINNETGWRYLLFAALNIYGYVIVIFYCSKSLRAQDAVAKGLFMGLLTNLLIATWEVSTGGHIVPLTSEYIRRFAYRPLGFFANTNDLSVVILGGLIALLVWFMQKRRGKAKGLFFTAAAVYALYIIVTANCTTCILLVPFIAFLTLLLYKNKDGGSIRLFAVIFATFLMLVFVLLGGIDIIAGRYLGDVDFNTVSGRSEIWIEALKAFHQSNWLGIGPGQSGVKALGLAHNIAIELLSEYGIVIFVMIVCSYLNIIGYQMKKSGTISNSIGKVFTLMIVPLSIASSSITKLFPFWIAFALIICCDEEKVKNDSYSCANVSYKRKSV